MNDPNQQVISELFLDYIFSKTYEDFLVNKGIEFDSTNLSLISGLIYGRETAAIEIDNSFRFKTYFIYLISLLSEYLKTNEEKVLKKLFPILISPNEDCAFPLKMMEELKQIIGKRVSFMLSQNKLSDKHKKEFEGMQYHLLSDNNNNDFEDYDSDNLYKELCDSLKRNIGELNKCVISKLIEGPIYESDETDAEPTDLSLKICSSKKKARHKSREHVDKPNSIIHVNNPCCDRSLVQNRSIENCSNKSIQQVHSAKNTPKSKTQRNKENSFKSISNEKLDETEQKFNSDNYISSDDSETNNPTSVKKLFKKKSLPKTISNSKMNSNKKIHHKITLDISDNKSDGESDDLDFDQSKDETISKKLRKPLKRKSDNGPENTLEDAATPSGTPKKNSKRSLATSLSYLATESEEEEVAKPRKNSWSKNETTWLVVGVLLYEKGNWAQILSKFEEKFNKRTSVMLKDKYRTLENNPKMLKDIKTLAKQIKEQLSIKP